ncbi:MAG TPA: hypothetical protein VK780_04435 [Thermoanaerobaculia bacterium]|jgi:hypothetical protein|nr:hypothetical protein [Thermoanaerobaculia bacterium]
MSLEADPNTMYEVAIDAAAIRWESATPLFTRYRVPLVGLFDEAWLDCYERASLDSAEFSRFRFDDATRTVSFTCRMNDGPTEVSSVIQRLELLVAYVNASAGRPGVRPFVERRRRSDPNVEDAASD